MMAQPRALFQRPPATLRDLLKPVELDIGARQHPRLDLCRRRHSRTDGSFKKFSVNNEIHPNKKVYLSHGRPFGTAVTELFDV
jgi:hypothetical protein